MDRMEGRNEQALDRIAGEAFWNAEPSPGLGAVHLLAGEHDTDLAAWGRMTPDQFKGELYVRFGQRWPGWSCRQYSEAAESARAAMAEALYENADRSLRGQAGAMMQRTARAFDAMAADPQATAGMVRWLADQPAGADRIALIEALGLEPEAARGLDVQLANAPAERVIERLAGAQGLALHSRPPLRLAELQTGLRRAAADLRLLAGRLERDDGVHVFELCPDLARGLLSRLDSDSLAHRAIRDRLEQKRYCRRVDQAIERVGGLLIQIGALMGGPLASAAAMTLSGGQALAGLDRAAEQRRLVGLARLAGTSGRTDFTHARRLADRDLGLNLAGSMGAGAPGDMLLDLLATFEHRAINQAFLNHFRSDQGRRMRSHSPTSRPAGG